jgi:transcriptional regulator GlxA family with amidase domain
MMTGHFLLRSIVGLFARSFSPVTRQGVRSPRDEEFLERTQAVVQRHLADPLFSTSAAAEELLLSRMHLNRRLRSLTGMSTHEFITATRLRNAGEMLLQSSAPVVAVSSAVGFRRASQFSRVFREWYGMPPSLYRIVHPHNSVLSLLRTRDNAKIE